MDTLTHNVTTCQLCPKLERAPVAPAPPKTRLACLASGRHYVEHCLEGSCPLKLFAEPGTTGRPSRAAAAAPVNPSIVAMTGPRLWAELHRRPIEAPDPPDPAKESAWLMGFEIRLPCGECKTHWRQMVADCPPRLRSRFDYAQWTWLMHDFVNARLGKSRPSYDEMAKLYGWPECPIGPAAAELRSPAVGASSDM